jgi:hypothetical protein
MDDGKSSTVHKKSECRLLSHRSALETGIDTRCIDRDDKTLNVAAESTRDYSKLGLIACSFFKEGRYALGDFTRARDVGDDFLSKSATANDNEIMRKLIVVIVMIGCR